MIQEHADAVYEALDAVVTVYDAVVDVVNPSLPYVVLYTDDGVSEVESPNAADLYRAWGFQTTCVGLTAASVRVVSELVETVLLGVTLSVDGRNVGAIEKDSAQPIRRDDDVQPPLLYATQQWSFISG